MKNAIKKIPMRMSMRIAEDIWGLLSKPARISLRELIVCYGLSVVAGDLQCLGERWYVTHAGLLGLAQRKHCAGINVCRCGTSVTQGNVAGFFAPPFISLGRQRGLLVTAMPTPRMSPHWSAAPRCA